VRIIESAAWVWVVAATALYLRQFTELLPALRRLIGL